MAMLKIVSGTLDSNAIEIEIKGTRFIASNETLEHVEVAEGNVHILIDTISRAMVELSIAVCVAREQMLSRRRCHR